MTEESKVPAWDATKFRLSVSPAVQHAHDPSIVEVNPATAEALGFAMSYVVIKVRRVPGRRGDVLVVRALTPLARRVVQGKMRLRQYATVMANADVPERVVACGDVIRRNLRVSEGDLVTVKPCTPKKLREVVLFPIKESVEDAPPGSLPGFLEAYFSGTPIPRPIGAENLISVPGGGAQPYWFKVGKVKPVSGSDKFGFVDPTQEVNAETGQVTRARTVLRVEAPIKQKDGEKFITRMGYGDVGGLKQQLRTIRENVELPLKFPKLFTAIGVKPPKGAPRYHVAPAALLLPGTPHVPRPTVLSPSCAFALLCARVQVCSCTARLAVARRSSHVPSPTSWGAST